MFGIDPLYIAMILPVLLFSMWASVKVKSSFSKYSKIPASSGMTGKDTAEYILRANGLAHVKVVKSSGFLSDHYDPKAKEVRLSPDVYSSNSISSIGVAAHETGHALQHAEKYSPLAIRSAVVPMASIGSWGSYIIIFLGMIINSAGLMQLGIILFGAVVFFQIITLPVEFNASTRAKELVRRYSIVGPNEIGGVEKVLSAAAMTYVAAAASAIVTLLYYLIRLGLLSGRDD